MSAYGHHTYPSVLTSIWGSNPPFETYHAFNAEFTIQEIRRKSYAWYLIRRYRVAKSYWLEYGYSNREAAGRAKADVKRHRRLAT
jgi:hypothetical protein